MPVQQRLKMHLMKLLVNSKHAVEGIMSSENIIPQGRTGNANHSSPVKYNNGAKPDEMKKKALGLKYEMARVYVLT
jgi:hypothetical protein